MANDSLPPEADILDRNDDFNKTMAGLSKTYTRRRVVDTLLGVIIALAIGIVAGLLYLDYHLENKIEKTDQNETQLICAHLDNPSHFLGCVNVGPPVTIGK